jgi:hypothetical protein
MPIYRFLLGNEKLAFRSSGDGRSLMEEQKRILRGRGFLK